MTEKSRFINMQRKCPRCGKILDRIDDICPRCGKKMPVKEVAKDHLFQTRFDGGN